MEFNEYILNVLINKQKTSIKTYASSPEEAIDNAILMETVEDLYSVEDIKNKKQLNFLSDFKEMRNLREQVPSELEPLLHEILSNMKHFKELI
tara:strand:- start:8202 stop:8480 length:279 start_codon:yes stop_codon:yes gene_type:complete